MSKKVINEIIKKLTNIIQFLSYFLVTFFYFVKDRLKFSIHRRFHYAQRCIYIQFCILFINNKLCLIPKIFQFSLTRQSHLDRSGFHIITVFISYSLFSIHVLLSQLLEFQDRYHIIISFTKNVRQLRINLFIMCILGYFQGRISSLMYSSRMCFVLFRLSSLIPAPHMHIIQQARLEFCIDKFLFYLIEIIMN